MPSPSSSQRPMWRSNPPPSVAQSLHTLQQEAAQLRALHASINSNNNNSHNNNGSRRSISGHSKSPLKDRSLITPRSAKDYPVFTPSYENFVLGVKGNTEEVMESVEWQEPSQNRNSTDRPKDYNTMSMDFSPHHFAAAFVKKAKEKKIAEAVESGFSCDVCKPVSTVVPLMSSQDFSDIAPKDKTGNNRFKAWFFRGGGKKKPQPAPPPPPPPKEEGEEIPAWIMESLDLKKREEHDAVMEVLQLRLAMAEMGKKLEQLEMYCQDLKPKEEDKVVKTGLSLPTTSEILHAVTETRVAVKQFCRVLVQQIQEAEHVRAMEKVSSMLQHHEKMATYKVSRSMRYELESLINQAFFQDFENVSFMRNGTDEILGSRARCLGYYKSYGWMCKIGWREAVSKSEMFDVFCREKMGLIECVVEWKGRWPDELAEAFFVSARSMWLLHLLAFSYDPPAAIFRIAEGKKFDGRYMEEVHVERHKTKQREENALSIRLMVMPGFFFHDQIVKCKVLCKPK